MAHLDLELWRQIGERLREVLPADQVEKFAFDHGLRGVRLDRIMKGRKGTSVESLAKICQEADISPTWLIFGIGKRELSSQPGAGLLPGRQKDIDSQYQKQLEDILENSSKRTEDSTLDRIRRLLDESKTAPRKPRSRTHSRAKKQA